MSTSIEERILSSLSNSEIFSKNNSKAQQYIDSVITENFHEERLVEGFDAIEEISENKLVTIFCDYFLFLDYL
ncbi:hypothetical protein ACIQ7N_04145 [Lysinibacillus sp. NPDC095746]|uniref:hypothetical protein n=1 Tax=Lysinibacillus sp. NPDC095746 TaxID=3364134 RepID=UPI00382EAEF1